MADLERQDNLGVIEDGAADVVSRRVRSGIRANKHWALAGMAGTNLGHTTILARMTVKEFCNISVVGNHATVDKEDSEFKGQFVAQRELTPSHAKGLALYILRGLVVAAILRRGENNRPVTARIREIANDLAGGPYQGLQPFTANIRDWTDSDYNQLVAIDKEFALYKILLPVLIKLWVVDGQHRRHALNLVLRYLEQLLKDNAYPRAKSHNLYFSDEAGTNGAIDAETLEFWQEVYDILIEEHSITMEVHLGLNEEQEKQLFVDLNSRGKKLSASMLGEYDRSDAIAVLSAKLRDDNVITVPIFSDSDAKDWETAGLTFSDIVMVNRLLIHGANSKAPTPQAVVNDKLDFVEHFWTTVREVPGFVDVDARSKTVVAQPVMLKALAKLAFDLGYGKTSLQDDEALKKLFMAMCKERDLFSHDQVIWRALFLNDADRAAQFGAPINQFVYVNNQLVGKTGNVDENGKVRFGHAHNDIYPRLGDILRWHLGLANRGAANKAREKEGRPLWGQTESLRPRAKHLSKPKWGANRRPNLPFRTLGEVSMAYDVKVLKTLADCRRVIERAIKAGDTDLERRALARVAELGGGDHSDPLVSAFYSTLAVYEQTLPRGRANYLRRKLSNLGGGVSAIEQILRDWCIDKSLSSGFHHLLEKGLKEHVGEYIVGVRFPERFPAEVVTAAREKLTEYGIVKHDEFQRLTADTI